MDGGPNSIATARSPDTTARSADTTARNPDNNVVQSFDGRYLAYWRGRVVFESAGLKIKRFKCERDARDYLALCDALGKRA